MADPETKTGPISSGAHLSVSAGETGDVSQGFPGRASGRETCLPTQETQETKV